MLCYSVLYDSMPYQGMPHNHAICTVPIFIEQIHRTWASAILQNENMILNINSYAQGFEEKSWRKGTVLMDIVHYHHRCATCILQQVKSARVDRVEGRPTSEPVFASVACRTRATIIYHACHAQPVLRSVHTVACYRSPLMCTCIIDACCILLCISWAARVQHEHV